ncbi:hypothetical protein [Teichococcus oryzae]|uniref:Uncharacterized protein n=1 Tax=Teichococcus oryzae TaxID=1608942 RepID=A0A5B2TJ11_9PROT|nr:hypothetical protein [Pseudoroseomonas oryzae]KAA2214477.1 hypothetical protein F0Q34_01775 [Pseudoroseomonas oryzae]
MSRPETPAGATRHQLLELVMPLPSSDLPSANPAAAALPLARPPAGDAEAARHALLLRTGAVAAGPDAEPPRRPDALPRRR